MSSIVYCNSIILQPIVPYVVAIGAGFIVMHDLCTFESSVAMHFLEDHNIALQPWLSQFSDLNPIKNIRNVFQQRKEYYIWGCFGIIGKSCFWLNQNLEFSHKEIKDNLNFLCHENVLYSKQHRMNCKLLKIHGVLFSHKRNI